jgi:hypothetical protein
MCQKPDVERYTDNYRVSTSESYVYSLLGGAEMPTLKADPGSVYQIEVQLNDVEPEIWRRILVPAGETLDRIHQIIQAAMGWQDSHLHQFTSGEDTYTEVDPDTDENSQPEAAVAIGALLHAPGESLLYEYDFGDGWEHTVTLEQVLSGVGDRVLPICIDGQRACPPEDVGGPHGYQEFLRAYLDLQHPNHREMVDWAGEEFDPERFEIESVNSTLSAN